MGSGKCSLTLSPRLFASHSSIQFQTRVCASYPTQRRPGQTGRQGWPQSPRRAVPSNSESRGPHLVLKQQEPLSGPEVEKMEVLGEPQNQNPSPMRPPSSREQKQRLLRATGSHLPPLPEPAESSAKSELPGRRTAPRRGTAPAERAGGGRVSAPRAAGPGEACLHQSPKGWAAAARRRLCSWVLGAGGGELYGVWGGVGVGEI